MVAAPAAVIATLALSGCSVRYSNQSAVAGGTQTSQISVSSGSVLGTALIAGIVVADGVRYYRIGPNGTKSPISYVPDPDPSRRVNAQDCTRPVDPAAGNLLCR